MTSDRDSAIGHPLPRHGRSGFWQVFVWLAIGIAVLLAVPIVWNLRASQRLETVLAAIRAKGEPVTAEDLNAVYQASFPTPNAASFYEKAFDLASNARANEELRALENSLPVVGTGTTVRLEESLPPETLQQIETYLAGKRDAMDMVRKGASAGECAFPVHLSKGVATSLPHLAKLRGMARILRLKNLADISRGKTDEAVEDVVLTAKLSGTLRKAPVLICGLVRVALLGIAKSETERTLTHCGLSNEQLRQLDDALADQKDIAEIQRLYIGERTFGVSVFASIRQRPETFLELIEMSKFCFPPSSPPKWKQMMVRFLSPFVQGWLKDQETACLNYYAQIIEACRLPPREMLKRMAKLEQQIEQHGSRSFPVLLMSALDAAAAKHIQALQSLVLARTAVAVETFRNDKGQLPDSLDALVPQYLPAVPEDVFAEGKIRYAKDAKGYRLWSVDKDGKDNGGEEAPKGEKPRDIVFRVAR